ncbi:HSP20-like chaperone [Suillus ampliporus]|nr:HSP20-like chaperone [Suillus ampliporus]
MSLTRFPYDPLTEFGRLFDEFTSRVRLSIASSKSSLSNNSRLCPKMDLIENKNNQIMAKFELPGITSRVVKVCVHNDRLTISGAFQNRTTADDEFLVGERSYGRFARTLQLPEGTKPEQVKARIENGVLEVTFPKAPFPKAPTTSIDIVWMNETQDSTSGEIVMYF